MKHHPMDSNWSSSYFESFLCPVELLLSIPPTPRMISLTRASTDNLARESNAEMSLLHTTSVSTTFTSPSLSQLSRWASFLSMKVLQLCLVNCFRLLLTHRVCCWSIAMICCGSSDYFCQENEEPMGTDPSPTYSFRARTIEISTLYFTPFRRQLVPSSFELITSLHFGACNFRSLKWNRLLPPRSFVPKRTPEEEVACLRQKGAVIEQPHLHGLDPMRLSRKRDPTWYSARSCTVERLAGHVEDVWLATYPNISIVYNTNSSPQGFCRMSADLHYKCFEGLLYWPFWSSN